MTYEFPASSCRARQSSRYRALVFQFHQSAGILGVDDQLWRRRACCLSSVDYPQQVTRQEDDFDRLLGIL
jgi:hypothetical protein